MKIKWTQCRYIILILLCHVIISRHTVAIPKVVSLTPAITEIIYALSAESLICGVTTACNYPKQAINLPKVGDFLKPNIEKIMRLTPTLVIGEKGMQGVIVAQLEKAGIQTILIPNPRTIKEIVASIKIIGQALNREQQADVLVETIRNQLSDLKAPVNAIQKKVAIVIWYPPLMVAGKYSYLTDLLNQCNLTSSFDTIHQMYPVIDMELLIRNNPDIIIIDKDKKESFINDQRVKRLLSSANVYGVDMDAMLRPGPRSVKAFSVFVNGLLEK